VSSRKVAEPVFNQTTSIKFITLGLKVVTKNNQSYEKTQ